MVLERPAVRRYAPVQHFRPVRYQSFMMKLSDLSEIKRFSAVVVSLAAAIFLFFQPVAACSRDYRIWQPRSKNDINKSGKFVLEPRFLTAGSLHNGLAAV